MKNDELPMNPENPSPFEQPFLVLRFGESLNETEWWHVDVDGMIERYIHGGLKATGSHVDRTHDATDHMLDMMKEFERRGIPIRFIGTYNGSAGHTHVLRNGAFFKRMKLVEDSVSVENSKPSTPPWAFIGCAE